MNEVTTDTPPLTLETVDAEETIPKDINSSTATDVVANKVHQLMSRDEYPVDAIFTYEEYLTYNHRCKYIVETSQYGLVYIGNI